MTTPNEPLAIVGLGCRFPGGAHTPDAYLDFLRDQGDGVVPQPADRWSVERFHDPDPDAAGRTPVRRGGFLQTDIFSFDPTFFGISPREAAAIDPQQRLLLEVAWEAFEDAGLPAETLAGSPTGVFIGGFTLDNMLVRFAAESHDGIDNHTATSSSMTLLSNRLSYVFDLRGPSLTVDTACSSSLVALHLGCEAVRRGDCKRAVIGGVNVMLLPSYQVVMSKGHFLAPDGRSKTFEAEANGYGRGEGAGIVVIEPLSEALAAGRRIHAVIRATGVNQDGATDGIPMPNPDAQRELVAATCARAGIAPQSIGYVEAHGTGTRAGDPIETSAIGAVYGNERATPLPIGSVKAQIGHLEAAAGVAGLIKAVLSVREGQVLPHRPLRDPNPAIDFDGLKLRVPQDVEPWPVDDVPRAAVNSFGYGGTNAHAIVEAPPRRAPTTWNARATAGQLVPVSARSDEGLAATAGALLEVVDDHEVAALAGALAHRRSHHPVRATVLVREPGDLRAGLEALASGEADDRVIGPEAPREGLVWVFTGMGPQWWRMGRDLYEQEPTFRAILDDVDRRFEAEAGWSILAEMLADEAESRMTTNEVAQPANLLLQIGLVTLLRERGPEPDAILGHSVGEVAAAWAAGCLTLDEAVTVAVHRSRLQQRAAGQGGMLAVGVGRDDVADLLDGVDDVVVAADNSPGLVTLAGPHGALEHVAIRAEASGIFAKRVRVEVPYHSPAMDPLQDEMLASLADLKPRPPRCPLYSTMTGARVESAVHDATYWWRNTRQAVLLRDASETVVADGLRTFLEIGPHPVLGASIQGTAAAAGASIRTLACLRRKQPEQTTLMAALATLHALGHDLPWDVLAPEGAPVSLPLTPWQRQHHWFETPAMRAFRLGSDSSHPLLARRASGPRPAWSTRLAGPRLSRLREHVVDGVAVMPGAATLEACLAVAAELGHEPVVEDVHFEQALLLGRDADLRIEVDDERVVVSGRKEGRDWSRHATARLVPRGRYRPLRNLDLNRLRMAMIENVDVPALYEDLAARGLDYGPAFRGLNAMWRMGDELLAQLTLPDDVPLDGFTLHPALLDAAFQAMVAVAEAPRGTTVLPVGVRRIRATEALGREAWLRARVRPAGDDAWEANLLLATPDGRVVADVRGLRLQATLGRGAGPSPLHHEEFVAVEAPADPGGSLNVIGTGELATSLRATLGDRLAHHADRVVLIAPADRDLETACSDLLETFRSLPETLDRLLVVTVRGSVAAPGDDVDPVAAALQGLVRVAMTEQPRRSVRLLDVDGDVLPGAVLAGLGDPLAEEELVLREGQLRGRRIVRSSPDELPSATADVPIPAGSQPMALETDAPGRLEALGFRALHRRAPGAGEVEIAVKAASLNFKDVMKAMGMLSDTALENAYLGRGLGLEAAGVVTRVGPGVFDLAPGDPVFTYAGGALRTHLVVDRRFVVRRPDGVDAVRGSCMFVMLTAWYALMHAGRLSDRDTVLVHSAAGGVGLAAVRIARHVGARVIATAGTPEKRQYLRGLGIDHVFDSRTLDFVDEVREATGGRGVDVVLNALAGPALVRSLDLLAAGGRFLELGKQDITNDLRLGLLPFNRAISFHAIDLDRMATEDPSWFEPVATEVVEALASNQLPPLPTEVYPADRVQDAFRDLASGNRIGKVVVDLHAGTVPLRPAHGRPLATDRTWLVTGGLGGFGLRMADWLAQRGVRDLVLASRRGVAALEDAAVIDRLRARRIQVREVALDVTDLDAVQQAVSAIPDLGGVLHAAMVLADRPLDVLTDDDLGSALGAKARGAWNLHRATSHLRLDHFVLVGSISAQVGNPGQGAYAAANAYLDGLAAHRAARGLPALCVSFGALGEAGVVARDEATRVHLESLGLRAMPAKVALDGFGEALAAGTPHCTVVDIDWDRWARAVPGVGWTRLCEVLSAAADSEGTGGLASLPAAERRIAAIDTLRGAAAEVFRTDPERLDPARSLRDQGLDSIVAVELGLAIADRVGVELSALDLLGGRTLEELADTVLARLGLQGEVTDPEPSVPASPVVVTSSSAEALRSRILVAAPYDQLEDLTLDHEVVRAEVVPDVVGEGRSPVAAAEVGRHLAILGSMACARAWPAPGRHVWPVARADLEVEPGRPAAPGTRFELEARCVTVEPGRGRAEAEGVMRDESGAVVGRLHVTYHVMSEDAFRRHFAEHAVDAPRSSHSPYGEAPPRPEGAWDGTTFVRELPSIDATACAGHFPGLPAMPVSILGRCVQDAVLDGMAASGVETAGISVRRARLETLRFAWAGEALRIEARPEPKGGTWRCSLIAHAASGDEPVATFVLETAVQPVEQLVPVTVRVPAA